MMLTSRIPSREHAPKTKRHAPQRIKKDKKIREDLSEDQVDDMVDGSFPASDPPSTY